MPFYLFVGIPLQGFTVALFYCFLNAEVKNTVRHHYNSWHTRRTLGSRRTRYSSSKDWSSQARDSMRYGPKRSGLSTLKY